MIQSFKHKGLELYFKTGIRSGIQAKHSNRLRLILAQLNAALVVNYEDYHWGIIILMHNPSHPGLILKELCIDPLNLSVTSAAKALGVSRKTLSCIINGKAGISPEMAVRLSIAFNTSSESWVNQPAQYDLWQAEQHRHELKVTPLSAA